VIIRSKVRWNRRLSLKLEEWKYKSVGRQYTKQVSLGSSQEGRESSSYLGPTNVGYWKVKGNFLDKSLWMDVLSKRVLE